ncbi:triphosphoribosyl-dephospho-CoA synthetase [bacterium]|nr:triphosphoribosyl-dephospho-CoA synthetase [bacterium]
MTASSARTLAEQIELACLLEATARKPGNVHPGASFDDLTYTDFVNAATACALPLAEAAAVGIGSAILNAVRETRAVCQTNVNLGICLLVAPIAAVEEMQQSDRELPERLSATTIADAEAVYTAIRLATAGGLGQIDEHDVSAVPTISLMEAMRLAEERDAIATEWAHGFEGIRGELTKWLVAAWDHAQQHPASIDLNGIVVPAWELAILQTQLRFLTRGDTLIARKCGRDVSDAAAQQAQAILAAGGWVNSTGRELITRFDGWLRGDGHRRNPGTTADLLAACLFYVIRKGWITPPTRAEVLQHAERVASASSKKL